MAEEIKDLQVEIEEYKIKRKRQAEELDSIKLANEALHQKISDVYDNNFIIAKDQINQGVSAKQSEPILQIQEEVRALHN